MVLSDDESLFLIEQAGKAPSGHNTQPWQFLLHDSGIDIRPDYRRALPVVEPDHRELFVSLGCAAENLCIAAAHRGYHTSLSIDDNGIIRIRLSRTMPPQSAQHFAHISVRQTNRSLYNGKRIPAHDMATLRSVTTENGIAIHDFANGTPAYAAIADLIYASNRLQMRSQAFCHELQQWMRYNKKHQDDTRDGLSYAVFGAPNLPRFLAQFIITHTLNADSQNRSERKKIAAASHFILLTAHDNTRVQWIQLGRTLQRLLLTATALDIAHAYANQPNEIPELSEKMATILGITEEHPVILLRLGYGKPMPYSLRKPASATLADT